MTGLQPGSVLGIETATYSVVVGNGVCVGRKIKMKKGCRLVVVALAVIDDGETCDPNKVLEELGWKHSDREKAATKKRRRSNAT